MSEKMSPAIVPRAKSNQNTSLGPSMRNGTSPTTVDTTVMEIGRILWQNALMYDLQAHVFPTEFTY